MVARSWRIQKKIRYLGLVSVNGNRLVEAAECKFLQVVYQQSNLENPIFADFEVPNSDELDCALFASHQEASNGTAEWCFDLTSPA